MKAKILTLLFLLTILMISAATPKEGIAMHRAGKYEAAAPIFRDIIRETPINYPIYKYLIDSLFQIGEYEEALEYIRRLEKSPNITAKKALDYETYVSILIELKKLDLALEKVNAGLAVSEDIITSNHLKRLKYLILVELKKFDEAEQSIKSESGWNNNPLLLYNLGEIYFHYAGMESDAEKLDQGMKYFGESFQASRSTANVNTEKLLVDYLEQWASDIDGLPQKIRFLKDVHKNGVDSAELQSTLEKYEKNNEYLNKTRELNGYIKAKDTKKALVLLRQLEIKFPDKNLKIFRSRIEEQKKNTIKQYAIFGGGGLGALIFIFLIVKAIKAGEGKRKEKAELRKEKKRQHQEEKERKEEEKRHAVEEKKRKEEERKLKRKAAKEKTPEPEPPKEAEDEPQDIEPAKKEKVPTSAEESVEESPAEESAPEQSASSTEEEKDLKTEVETEASSTSEHEKEEESESEERIEDAPEEQPAEPSDEEQDKTEDEPELSKDELLDAYIGIALADDPEGEKSFVKKYGSPETMSAFKNIHFIFAGKINKVFEYFKKSNIQQEQWWMSKAAEIIMSEEVESVEEAAILYLYFRETGDKEKEDKFKKLGKKLRDEKKD